MREVLNLPGYRRLLASYTLNELAWSFGVLALAVLVYRRTGSAVATAGFFLCSQFGPALISPLVVARLERRRVRRVLPVLYSLEAVAFLVLAWVAGRFALAPVLALTLADGTVAVTARALARTATVQVTGAAGLLRDGNALMNAAFSICFMAGPALAGVVVVAGGTQTALLVNTALFTAIALTLATASQLPGPVADHPAVAGRVRGALAHAREVPAIRALLSLQSVALVFFTISIPVEVVFAQRSLHAGAAGYAAFLSSWGAGAVAGSAIFARWRGLPARQLIAIGAGSLGIGFLTMAVAPSLPVAIIGCAIAGAGNGVETVSARTALQEHVEPEWMAMMMSLNESLFESMPGIGILIGGALAALASPRTALGVAGVGALLVTAAAWFVLRPTILPELRIRAGTPTYTGDDQGRSQEASGTVTPAPAARYD